MISFKEFIAEGKVTPWEQTGVELDKAYDSIMANCSAAMEHAITSGVVLYRGDKQLHPSISVIDTSNGERTSRDTNNLYQLMMDTSAELKHIPSRSKSLICSTSYSVASGYGHCYVVLPYDGATLAYSPKTRDFLRTRVTSTLVTADVDDIGFYLSRFLRDLDIGASGPQIGKYRDVSRLDTHLAKCSIDEIFIAWMTVNPLPEYFEGKDNAKLIAHSDDIRKLLKAKAPMSSEGKRIFDILAKLNTSKRFTGLCSQIFNMDTINIRYTDIDGINKFGDEVWFSGKCLMLKAETFAEILIKEYFNKKKPIDHTLMTNLSSELKKARAQHDKF